MSEDRLADRAHRSQEPLLPSLRGEKKDSHTVFFSVCQTGCTREQEPFVFSKSLLGTHRRKLLETDPHLAFGCTGGDKRAGKRNSC